MMQKLQRFGGAMFTPVLLFAFSGLMVGITTVMQQPMIFGDLASPDSLWFQVWNVIREGAWTVFRQVPLLFVISLPVGLAKKQNARASMVAFVVYMTFNYMLAAMLANWGANYGVDYSLDPTSGSGLTLIGSVKTLDTGMVGALIISGIVVFLHNKYFDTKLPEWLGTFSGASFVALLGFFAMIPVAFLFLVIWPQIQHMIAGLQNFFINANLLGVWVFNFLERILIPTGLHHFIYMPFAFDNVVIQGGIRAAWAENISTFAESTESLATLFPAGGYGMFGLTKVFSPIGISAALYFTARKEKRKEVLGLIIPVALTAMFAGITEPIEFTFLFIAPVLFLVHSILAATLVTTAFAAGISGEFSSGLINWTALNFLPLGYNHWQQYLLLFAIGLSFSVIWFVVFRFMILKFDYKTPGREELDQEAKLVSKKEYKESRQNSNQTKGTDVNTDQAIAYLELLGGADNIVDVTNCATRLRVTVDDSDLVRTTDDFKSVGAHGLVKNGKNFQVIVGLSVPSVREEFENLLARE